MKTTLKWSKQGIRSNVWQKQLLFFLLFIVTSIIMPSCKPDPIIIIIPEVSTISVSDITENGAVVLGKLKFAGGGDILERGFYLNGNKMLTDNNDEAEFALKLSQLQDNTKYFVQAFARNRAGTGYGDSLEFITLRKEVPTLPSLIIWEASNIGQHLATLNCLIGKTDNLAALSFIFEYSQEANLANFKTIEAELLDYQPMGKIAYAEVSALEENTTYYYRLCVSDGEQVVYSTITSFTTIADETSPLPGMEIVEATDISIHEATLNAFIDRNTDLEGITFSFEYSTLPDFSSYQTKMAIIELKVNGAQAGAIADNLEAETLYYYRLKAMRDGEVAYSAITSFTTLAAETSSLPGMEILEATNVSRYKATLNAFIDRNTDLEDIVFSFEYSLWSNFPSYQTKTAIIELKANGAQAWAIADSLEANHLYCYRLKAMRDGEVAYSPIGEFGADGDLFPEVMILAATNITANTATLNAVILSKELEDFEFIFQCDADFKFPNPIESNIILSDHPDGTFVSADVEDLWPGIKHHYRLKMIYDNEIAYSQVGFFETLDGPDPPVELPEAELLDVTNITESSAMVSAIIKSDDVSGIFVRFECSPYEDFSGSGDSFNPTFESHPEGLLASAVFEDLVEGTQYYYRLIMSAGSSSYTSPAKSFTTLIYSIPFRVFRGNLCIVATDEEGDVYVGGEKIEIFNDGTLAYAHGMVAKFNSQGDLLWESLILTNAGPNRVDKALIIKNGMIYAYNERNYKSKRYINVYDSETGVLLQEIDLGDVIFCDMTVDEEGYIFLTIDLNCLKKINPQGQVVKNITGYAYDAVTLFNDWVLVSSRENRNGLWYNKIVFLDKNLNIVWEDFGTTGSLSGVHISSIISFPESNEIVVVEQMYNNNRYVAYLNKYDITGNNLNIKWTHLYHENLTYFGLVKRNNSEFATFSFSLIGGPKVFNLDGYLLWEADPYKSGYVAINQSKLFLTIRSPSYFDTLKVYDLP
ncbi:MAG: hypothetical protein GX128_08710 [Bacteroidales bacterium]|jgi:hypothetical protein|nr:hypothetical protein [Bacteroidales bacterium]